RVVLALPAALLAEVPVDGLGYVQRLREPLGVDPHDAVADLEAGVLDGARETVRHPRPAEREQIAAGLEDPQRLPRPDLAPRLEEPGAVGGPLVEVRGVARAPVGPALVLVARAAHGVAAARVLGEV